MKKKMNLNNLKVKSFVTDLNEDIKVTIKGGEEPPTIDSFFMCYTTHNTVIVCLSRENTACTCPPPMPK